MRFAAESTPRCGALHGRAALVRITFEKSYTHYKRVSSPTPPPPKIFTNVVCSEGAAARGRMSLKGSLPGGKRRSAEQAARAPRPNGKRIKLHPQAAYRRGIREQAEYQANGACSQHSICQRVSGARCVRQHCISQHCIWTAAPGRAATEVGGGRKKRPQLLAALNRQLAAGTTSGGERDASLQPD